MIFNARELRRRREGGLRRKRRSRGSIGSSTALLGLSLGRAMTQHRARAWWWSGGGGRETLRFKSLRVRMRSLGVWWDEGLVWVGELLMRS